MGRRGRKKKGGDTEERNGREKGRKQRKEAAERKVEK